MALAGEVSVKAKAERNAEILRRRLAGETLAAIGVCFGITSQRVRQIEASAKPEAKASVLAERRAEILRRRRGGESLAQIGTVFGITRERVRQILEREAQRARG